MSRKQCPFSLNIPLAEIALDSPICGRGRPRPAAPYRYPDDHGSILAGLVGHAHDARRELADDLHQLVLRRDHRLDVLVRLWRLVHPTAKQCHATLAQIRVTL